MTTLQAISGAGYPGVSAMDITDNVIPYIGDEEDKMEMEPQKILATVQTGITTISHVSLQTTCRQILPDPLISTHSACGCVLYEFSFLFIFFSAPTPALVPAPFVVSAQCNRVATLDGHMECVSIKLKKQPTNGVEEIEQCLREWKSEGLTSVIDTLT